MHIPGSGASEKTSEGEDPDDWCVTISTKMIKKLPAHHK